MARFSQDYGLESSVIQALLTEQLSFVLGDGNILGAIPLRGGAAQGQSVARAAAVAVSAESPMKEVRLDYERTPGSRDLHRAWFSPLPLLVLALYPVEAAPMKIPRKSSAIPSQSWRSLGLKTGAIGTPVGVGYLNPILGQALTITGAVLLVIVLIAALFGSKAISERAFRLLRWTANRPEPSGPTPSIGRSDIQPINRHCQHRHSVAVSPRAEHRPALKGNEMAVSSDAKPPPRDAPDDD